MKTGKNPEHAREPEQDLDKHTPGPWTTDGPANCTCSMRISIEQATGNIPAHRP